jgi:hypothetical protein
MTEIEKEVVDIITTELKKPPLNEFFTIVGVYRWQAAGRNHVRCIDNQTGVYYFIDTLDKLKFVKECFGIKEEAQ